MSKKTKNNSKRIKTSHKKALVKRKVVFTHVDKKMANINKFIDQQMAKSNEQTQTSKIELESMSFDELRKLLAGPSQKKRVGKLTVQDASCLQAMMKKWGTNYQRMSKDVKLNIMQWTAHQIQKKHLTYKQLVGQSQE